MYDDNENHPLQPFPLVVFCVVFFSNKLNKHSHPKWGGALRDDTKNGCVAD